MAVVQASCSIRPKVLERTANAALRDYTRAFEAWTSTYEGFRPRIPEPHKTRLDGFGRILWRFDLRYRWATGITALEFDDRIVTQATTAATKKGYFLLMRLVDLWFVLEIAFDAYKALCVPSHVEHPSVFESLRVDAPKRLRALDAAARGVNQRLKRGRRKPEAQARVQQWLARLVETTDTSSTTGLVEEAARLLEKGRALGPHHLGASANLVRNQYVHGGETASSRGLPAQEKVPVLRLLTGFTAIASLDLATQAALEAVKQPVKFARF